MSDTESSSEEEPGDLKKILDNRAKNAVTGITQHRPMVKTPGPVDSNRQPLLSHEEKSSCPERCIGNICWPCRVFKGALGLGGRRRKKTKRKSRRKSKKRKKKRKKRRKTKRKKHRKSKKRKTHKKSKKNRSRTKHGGANLEEIPADGDRQAAKLIVRMLTNLESMESQAAIDRVVNAYKNRDRTRWQNYLDNMNRIYRLAEGEDDMLAAELQEIGERERIADRTRKPLAAQKEEEPTIGLAAQKIEEPPEQKREQKQ